MRQQFRILTYSSKNLTPRISIKENKDGPGVENSMTRPIKSEVLLYCNLWLSAVVTQTIRQVAWSSKQCSQTDPWCNSIYLEEFVSQTTVVLSLIQTWCKQPLLPWYQCNTNSLEQEAWICHVSCIELILQNSSLSALLISPVSGELPPSSTALIHCLADLYKWSRKQWNLVT